MSAADELKETLVAPASTDGSAPSFDHSIPPSPAARLAGRYELLGLLGTGGMGAVYRARDVELGEIVALKMLHPGLAADGRALERFRQEVRLARRVTHRNVARTFDIGEHGGARFLTMELVDGSSLASLIAERGALPLAEVVELGEAICAGLAAAHEAGVVHRDLKPENVLISNSGRVVVTDFGIARAHVEGDDASGTGALLVGTPAYMAPEQIRSEAVIDARADVYALGAVLFEMLTARQAWSGSSAIGLLATRLTTASPPDPRRFSPSLGPAVAAVVLRCMSEQPADRYAGADDVARALREALHAGPPVGAKGTFIDEAALPAARSATAATYVARGVADTAALPRQPSHKTVAVLPLTNRGNAADDYIADGLTDDLIDSLSVVPGLRVRPRGVVRPLQGRDDGAVELGRELGVQVIVHGSVRCDAQSIRIDVRLTSTADGFQLWARRVNASLGNLLVASEEAAHAIATALTTDMPVHNRQAPADPLVVELTLRARLELWRSWHKSGREAAELFERGLALAPSDPKLLAGCALAYTRMIFHGEGVRGEVTARALELTERAVVLAPELGDAWSARANLHLNLGDAIGAARALRTGLRHAPHYAMMQDMLGRLLVEAGAVEEGIKRLAIAVELDPNLVTARTDLARTHALLGDWARADALLDDDAGGEASVTRNAYRGRLALWRRGPPPTCAFAPNTFLSLISEALVAGKLTPEHRDFLKSRAGAASSRFRPFLLQLSAELYAFDGDVDAALEAVGEALQAGLLDIAWADRCPLFDHLRADDRWPALRTVIAARAARVLAALSDEGIS